MKVPFIDLRRSYQAHASALDACIHEVAQSGAYVLGTNVAAFEQAVAEYLGVSHAVAVGSGTDALHLALSAVGIGAGDEVVTSPFTFAATAEAIKYLGAVPVLVDVDRESFNIDPNQIEDAITARTRAILPVHMFGLPADMAAIASIADRHGLLVVEDCAQSFGATFEGRRVGGIGNAGAHSFYPTKTMGGLGDGGLVSTNDAAVDGRLRELRNHGIGPAGEHVRLGYNSRLDEIQAAVLRVKLEYIEQSNGQRRHIASRYNSLLADTAAKTPTSPPAAQHVYGYYTIVVDDRAALRSQLDEAGIGTAIYYPKPLHKHQYFGDSVAFDALPVAEDLASRCLSLPIFPEMTDEEVDYVATTIAALLPQAGSP
ncbi:MAG: aminotransferase class I/II-fold pyridoxal phosphate-dependent enzyme [Woeseiaceae bacterium]|nr:aminotransferase class I/II-fold pyridoxal phosphate-dependent enzyme [Woeseiaceae bacterium]NIP19879.1 aminotransferase class I/II-fold pyridoxal phosphate-dependent enzyme [Woeseiaceae bacterium]NIS88680.1 aminotransferase class I/II-fold pyridoxal phosphate-dependent enzyme [Woeseiaceae bacterium]